MMMNLHEQMTKAMDFCHLAGILYHYVRLAKQRTVSGSLENWIVSFLPVYGTWSLFVGVGLPIIFGYK